MNRQLLALPLLGLTAVALNAAPLPPALENFHKDGIRVTPDAPAVMHGLAGDKGDGNIHLLRLTKGQTYQLDVKAPFKTSFRIEEGVALMYSATSSKGSFVAPKDGVYRVVVAGPADGGKYTLSVVQERPGAFPADPPGVRTVGPGGLKLADNLVAGDAIDKVRRHPCKTYQVRLGAGKTYVIDMPAMFDTFLRVEDQAGKEIAADDDSGGGLNARIVLPVKANGIYTIICTSFSGGVGPFTLTVRENPK